MTEQMNESTEARVDEHVLLEKFNGDPADGDVIERIEILNGTIVKREYLENGVVVATTDGGEN